MKSLVRTFTLAICLLVPVVASAASISAIVLYSAYDSGDPNGATTFDGQLQAQLWRTGLGGDWYGLGVLSGLPPQSLAGPLLNNPDFTIDIALSEGENDFTLLGQPGPLTRTDDYSQYQVNLFLDGVLDHPAISVIFPRESLASGNPVSPSRSNMIYSADLNQVNFAPQATYDDSVDTVSVLAASFLPPETFGKDVDLVSAHRLGPSGEGNFIGVLRIMVQPSSDSGGGQAPFAPAAAGFGVIPGGIADSGTLHGPDIPIGGADPRDVAEPGVGPHGAAGNDWRAGAHGDDVAKATGTAPPTAAAAESTTPGGIPTAASTPRSRPPSGTVSPSAAAGTTVTPVATGAGATPTPRVSTTAAITTPSPAATHGSK